MASSSFHLSLESKLNDLAVDYASIHQKQIEKSYLARDLLRLYRKFKLYDGDEYIEWTPTSDSTPYLVSFLNTMCQMMDIKEYSGDEHGLPNGVYIDTNTGCLQITAQKYLDAVPHEQMHQSLTNFLVSTYGDSSKLCKLLKCVDQAYVVALLGNLAESLFFCRQPMRFKDIQGTWTISVRKNENNYSFIHHRREQMLKQINNAMLTETFQFSWELELISDSLEFEMLQTIRVRLLDIDWSSMSDKIQWSEEEKRSHEEEFRTMFGSSSEISISDIHKCVKKNKQSKEEMIEQRKQAIKNMESKYNSNNSPRVQNNTGDSAEAEGGYSCTIL